MTGYLASQLAVLLSRDPDVRTNDRGAVHEVRVATKGIRSILSTFRPIFDQRVTDPVRDELKWFAGVLGRAEDVELQRAHLRSAVAGEPADVDWGPVIDYLESAFRSSDLAASRTLLEVMDSPRYFALLDTLEALVARPPFSGEATGKAKKVLARPVRAASKELYRLAAADVPDQSGRRDQWRNEIRKAAERVRYAAELAEPALGKSGAELAATAAAIQETLADSQDSVVLRATLLYLGFAMHRDGANAFSIGRLHALQQVRGTAAEESFRAAWSAGFADVVKGWRKG